MYYNKSNLILTAIALLTLLVVTVSATYAYFTSKAEINSTLKLNTITSSAATFTAYTLDQISLDVTADDMFTPSAIASKTDNGNVVAVLSSPMEGSTVHCTYDIELIWDTTDQYITPTATLSGDYQYEISLKGTQNVSGDTTGHTYTVSSLNETNLTSFTWSGTAGTIGRKAKVITGAEIYSKSTSATTATWTFTVNFYTLPTDQSDLAGKSYGAHLAVTNVVC